MERRFEALAIVKRLPLLTGLYLRGNGIGDAGAEELRKQFPERVKVYW